jgi:hypothetical protein
MADPLPDADLHNLLNEFVHLIPTSSGTSNGVSEGANGASSTGPLSKVIPLRDDELKYDEAQKRGVAVRWVLSVSRKAAHRLAELTLQYTLVSKSRNVLKDKGYVVPKRWQVTRADEVQVYCSSGPLGMTCTRVSRLGMDASWGGIPAPLRSTVHLGKRTLNLRFHTLYSLLLSSRWLPHHFGHPCWRWAAKLRSTRLWTKFHWCR